MNCPVVSTPDDQVECSETCAWKNSNTGQCVMVGIEVSLHTIMSILNERRRFKF